MTAKMTREQIYITASQMFRMFEKDQINIEDFRKSLIDLSSNFDFEGYFMTHEKFVEEYIDAQFDSYKKYPECAYLLTYSSSGSLLRQFEPYEE